VVSVTCNTCASQADLFVAPSQAGVCTEQPTPLTALPAVPAVHRQSASKDNKPAFNATLSRTDTHSTVSPPSLQPLKLGDPLLARRPGHGRRRSSHGHAKRPSISAPNSFRRIEYTEGQRASLVPLRLGPVVLSEPPMPKAHVADSATDMLPCRTRNRSDSAQRLLPDSKRESYRAQRESPCQRCQQRSSTALDTNANTTASQNDQPPISGVAPISRPAPVSRQSSSSSLRQQAVVISAVSLPTRAPIERNRLRRKRSLQSMRKSTQDEKNLDVEKEILELKTIVEEQKLARPRSPEQHVSAIAPSMPLRARSETLDAIGSAFARPLTAREPSRIYDVFNSPEKPRRPSTSRTVSRTSSRVSGWLSGLLLTTSTPALTNEPFYKCVPPTHARQRAQSESSLCASVTELGSPTLTAASSPTTKCHSRSLTAESRLTSLSPQSTLYNPEWPVINKGAEEQWPIGTAPPSQVGLAF